MKVIILGATGQISQFLTSQLLKETKVDLTLFGHNVTQRLAIDDSRVQFIDGDLADEEKLVTALSGQDLVFLNVPLTDAMNTTHQAMKIAGVKRLVISGTIGLYDEVGGKFGEWGQSMMGSFAGRDDERAAIKSLEDDPQIDETYIRMTMLYNNAEKTDYTLIPFGETVTGAQVSRQAVANFVTAIVKQPDLEVHQNVAIIEKGSENMAKPSFY
ncbi:NAD(P)H-binding protein [Levilactobacillus humaensis]|uniref:NAD(P)H-binding protein n=1 Tax=Levilactobacillus humaensis TaxID=2950375 RepID=UPI0021C4B6E9|nr:NAD(P)H-binding protein [Levilactobacillus humaensis]